MLTCRKGPCSHERKLLQEGPKGDCDGQRVRAMPARGPSQKLADLVPTAESLTQAGELPAAQLEPTICYLDETLPQTATPRHLIKYSLRVTDPMHTQAMPLSLAHVTGPSSPVAPTLTRECQPRPGLTFTMLSRHGSQTTAMTASSPTGTAPVCLCVSPLSGQPTRLPRGEKGACS